MPSQSLETFRSTLPIFTHKFTTPSLDYKSHSKLLEQYVDLLYSFKKSLQTRPKAETIDHHGQSILLGLVVEFLRLFNIITSQEERKKAPIKVQITEIDLESLSTHDFDPTLSNAQRARYHFLRGKVINIFETYHERAEEDLSKAVKLDPYLIDAWKQLGECFWYKGDIEQAQNCFDFALDLNDKDPELFVLLATVKRRVGSLASDFAEIIRLCKKAIEIDSSFSDGWVGLGATYMSLYFKLTHNIDDLQRALDSYDKAIGSTNPDMYYSRAIIHQYLENVEQSILDLKKAWELDCQLENRCKHAIINTKKYVRELVKGSDTSIGMSNREIDTFKQKFTGLKPIQNEIFVKNLQNGANLKTNIRLLILRFVNRYHDHTGRLFYLIRSFIAMDQDGNFIGLSIFNLKPHTIQVSNFIIISNPNNVLIENKPLIRVDDPRTCWRNEKRIGPDDLLVVEMTVQSSFL